MNFFSTPRVCAHRVRLPGATAVASGICILPGQPFLNFTAQALPGSRADHPFQPARRARLPVLPAICAARRSQSPGCILERPGHLIPAGRGGDRPGWRWVGSGAERGSWGGLWGEGREGRAGRGGGRGPV